MSIILNGMENVFFDKSKIVYFRPKSFLETAYQFHCGSEIIEVVSQYKYLGPILTEFLDYNVKQQKLCLNLLVVLWTY